MAHTADPDILTVFSIGPRSESLFESFTCKQLRQLLQVRLLLQLGRCAAAAALVLTLPHQSVGNNELHHLVDSYLERYPIRLAEVAAGRHSVLLYFYAKFEGLQLEPLPATYALARGTRRTC